MPGWQASTTAWVRSPSGREVDFPLPAGMGQFAAVVPRRRARRRAGRPWPGPRASRCTTATRFTGVVRTDAPTGVVVDVDGLGAMAGRYVVGADGMWSPLRKALGLATPGYLGEWHAFRQYFDGVDRLRGRPPVGVVRARPAARLRVVVPAARTAGPTSASASSATADRRVQDMKALWPELLARPHIAEALGAGGRRRGAPQGLAHPGPHRPGRARGAGGRCSSATRPAPATR